MGRGVSPEIFEKQIQAYRAMDSSQKIQMMVDLNSFVTETQLSAIRAAHPEADEHEIKMRLASRWVKPELLKKAFGWDVAEKGY